MLMREIPSTVMQSGRDMIVISIKIDGRGDKSSHLSFSSKDFTCIKV